MALYSLSDLDQKKRANAKEAKSHELLVMSNLQAKNILVRMPNWLGDFVMATPVLKELKGAFPEARITAHVQRAFTPLLEADPHVDECLAFDRPKGLGKFLANGPAIKEIEDGAYDLGVLLTNSLSSSHLFWKGKVKHRLGFKGNLRNFMLTEAVPFPENKETQHLVHTYKDLLAPLGITPSESAPQLYLTEQEKKSVRENLAMQGMGSEQRIIGVNPGAAYGSAKCWLPERFKALTAELLQDPQCRVIYFGDKAGAPLVEEICRDFSSGVLNLAGKTSLRELLAYIEACDKFLTNDSGPMHAASALGVPLLALFGSTNDVATGPYNGGTVIHKRVECSPCYRRTCPIDFRCMKKIEVGEVYETLQKL